MIKKHILFLSTLILTLSVIGFSSCSQKQVVNTAEESTQPVLSDQEMEFKGYRKGTVVQFEGLSIPCDYQVELSASELIEALEFPKDFKEDGLEVWVKYSLQRRQTQCDNAQPVDILDIIRR